MNLKHFENDLLKKGDKYYSIYTLWDYCLANGWTENCSKSIIHDKLDVMILKGSSFNCDIIFNLSNRKLPSVKIIEYRLDLYQQLEIMNLYLDCYANPRINEPIKNSDVSFMSYWMESHA